MNGELFSTLPWSLLTAFAVVLAVFFGYIYRKERDKRKLMFMLAFAFASLSFLPLVLSELGNLWIMEGFSSWSSLPMLSAVLVAVFSSVLRTENFDKLYKAFLFVVAASIFMIIVPLPMKSLHPIVYQGISIIVIALSIYLVLVRREISDLMFLFSMACYISAGLGMTRDLAVEFIVAMNAFAYLFIALVFVTSKESRGGVASFFALQRKLEKTQEELRISQEKLVEAERLAAIGRAATMVGHDLRNPLQAIRNATYYLNKKLPSLYSPTSIPQKATEMLQVISDSVDYADKIVRDLKDFAVTEKPIPIKTDVNAIAKDVLLQVKVPENVETITELGPLPLIIGNGNMLKRVFLNIVVNGIQAMENGGRLNVSTQENNGFVEVSFEDTGVGIPKENIKKIFTPFFTTKAQGMGMGLPICKKIVDAHGGRIEVESEEGKGCLVTVKLPIPQENGVKNGREALIETKLIQRPHSPI